MLGQVAPVRGLMRRYHPPLASIAQWGSGRVARNIAVLESIHSSSDIDLDIAAFEKSLRQGTAAYYSDRLRSAKTSPLD